MPNPLILSFAQRSKKSVEYVEKIWDETKQSLLSQGMDENEKRFYPYLTTIVKRKLKIKESISSIKKFKDFLNEILK